MDSIYIAVQFQNDWKANDTETDAIDKQRGCRELAFMK